MKNNFLKILIVFMTFSILGLVAVQLYWLTKAFEANENDFNGRVYKAMDETIATIKAEELDKYYTLFNATRKTMKDNVDKPEVVASQIEVDSSNVKYVYLTRYMVDVTKIPTSSRYQDSLNVTELYSSEKTIKLKKDESPHSFQPLNVDMESEFKDATYSLERFAKFDAGNKPISQRINFKKADSIFKANLKKWNAYSPFKLAVLNSDSTRMVLKESGFNKTSENYILPLFSGKSNRTSYYLSAYLPKKFNTILSEFIPLAIVSSLLLIFILCIYIVSIYAMFKQRRISEMKTDFLNNMTHEFKTPIATISVATDALKTPLISGSPEKIKHYANLIKQENKRMNQQVENILRISKLERRQVKLDRSEVIMNQLVKDSVDSMRLIVENRNGTIFENYNAEDEEMSVDVFHMGNIFLNLLDNANKYSPEAPKITIDTYNEKGYFVLKVTDEGIGLSKQEQNKIFDKFYRANTGNIHTVKGHGLGLAYVKHIVDLHHGVVEVESSKGKGSSFYIKIPLK